MKKLLVLLALCMVLAVMFVACEQPETPVDETTAGTTEAPATDAPTEAPTTQAPETEAPTTETEAPTTETQAPTTETTTEEETTTEAPDPADPVFFAGAADLAGIAAAGSGIAGAEVVTEDGFEFVRITVNSGDPQFTVGSNIGVLPQYLAFVYRTTAEVDAEMFIGTSAGPNGQNDHVVLDWNNDGNWNILVVDLANCSSTNITDGQIGYFRLDPFRGATEGALDLAYIGFYNTAKYATDAFFANIATIVPAADMASSIPGSPGITSATMSADNTFVTIDSMASSDPYYQLPMLNQKGITGKFVAIKYRTTSTSYTTSEMFVGSGAGPNGQGDNIRFELTCDGKWHLAIVDLSQATAVVDNVVNYLRWDPFAGGANATIDMAYIGLFASEADALAYDATVAGLYVDTLNVPQDAWTVTGHKEGITPAEDPSHGPMVAAGGIATGALLHQGYISIGELDLAQFSKLIVYIGIDNSQVTLDHHAANAANRLILTSADQSMTMSPTDDVVIASVDYAPCGWAVTAFEIDLTGVDYNGPVYFTYDTLPGTFMLVGSIELVYDPNYVEPETPVDPEAPAAPEMVDKDACEDFDRFSFDGFYLNDSLYFETDGMANDKLQAINNTVTISGVNTIGYRGWISFKSAPAAAFGYYIVGVTEDIVVGEFLQERPDLAGAGIVNGTGYKIDVPVADLAAGTYTTGMVAILADGTAVMLYEITLIVE